MRSLLSAFCLLPSAFCLLLSAGPRYARWEIYDPASIKYLREAGITHVLVNEKATPEFIDACEKASMKVIRGAPADVQVVTQAKWPGLDPSVQIGAGGQGATTSATGEPWVDSNAWLVLYHRATSDKPVLLSYDPPKDTRLRPGSIELGVADATVFGGHFAIKLDDRMRAGLISGQPRAVAEWKRVARQLEFADGPLFRGTPVANIAVVVDRLEPVGEVMNLLARRNLPFAVIPRKDASVESFALVIVVGQQPLRIKGPIMVERKDVVDPSAFAAEVRKTLGDRRLYHLTNAETVISRPLRQENGGVALHLINYAIDPVRDVRVRLLSIGKFSRAQLSAPDRDKPEDLPIQNGEFAVPELRISAVILLQP